MPSRVTSFSLTATVYAHVELPSFINLNPEEEGSGWWVKWDTLYYKEGEEVKEYELKYLDYEGDYKHPGVEYVEEEEIKEESESEEEDIIPEDIEEAKEVWEEYKSNNTDEIITEKRLGWILAMEEKIALHHEQLADIARGK